MLEEGSKPRQEGAAPESATRTGPSWVKSPWIGVVGAFLVFLGLAGLILAATMPGQDFDLWFDLQRHYWLIAAASVLVCLGFGKRVQGDAIADLLNVRISGRFLLALGADSGLVAGILLGIDRVDHWHLESGLAALALADGIVAGAVLGRRLLAGPFRVPSIPLHAPVAAVSVDPGALIPFDGFVIGGRSEVDDGLVGGSPLGSLRGAGDIVHRGARNGDGRLTIDPMVEAPANPPGFSAATLLPKMIHAKALLIFIGLVVLAATLASIGAAPPDMRFELGLLVLAIATPVAIGLVRPMIHATVIRRARRLGWVLNGTATVDALADISALVCGRGGVVTRAGMEIVAVHPAIDVEAVELVAAAASIAQSSNGVWARALLRYAVSRKLRLAPLAEWTDEILETGVRAARHHAGRAGADRRLPRLGGGPGHPYLAAGEPGTREPDHRPPRTLGRAGDTGAGADRRHHRRRAAEARRLGDVQECQAIRPDRCAARSARRRGRRGTRALSGPAFCGGRHPGPEGDGDRMGDAPAETRDRAASRRSGAGCAGRPAAADGHAGRR